jgi:hypothetical protein
LTPPGQAAVHRPTGFDIDQHRSVDPSFACGVLIDTNHPWGRDFRFGQRAEQPQHRAATGGHPKAHVIRAQAQPAKAPDRTVDHTKIGPGHFGHLPSSVRAPAVTQSAGITESDPEPVLANKASGALKQVRCADEAACLGQGEVLPVTVF